MRIPVIKMRIRIRPNNADLGPYNVHGPHECLFILTVVFLLRHCQKGFPAFIHHLCTQTMTTKKMLIVGEGPECQGPHGPHHIL